MAKTHFLSFIIPVYNEAESLAALCSEIVTVAGKHRYRYEIIIINDGSTDTTQGVIEQLARRSKKIVSAEFRRNLGKARALQLGFELARGDVIVTLDGDLQDDPQEIPKLLAKIDEGYDVVSGWKLRRLDPPYRVVSSRIFNVLYDLCFGLTIHDSNSGFKAYRQEAVKTLRIYGELHRFIPALLVSRGFKVGEAVVKHRARKFGRSKYSNFKFISGLFDFATVMYLTKFQDRAFHFFGSIGSIMFGTGLSISGYLSFSKIVFGHPLSNRPLLLLAMLLMTLGGQVALFGLLAEQIYRLDFNRNRSAWIKKMVGGRRGKKEHQRQDYNRPSSR